MIQTIAKQLKTLTLLWCDSVQAAQEAVHQVADSSKETVNTGKVHTQHALYDNSGKEILQL